MSIVGFLIAILYAKDFARVDADVFDIEPGAPVASIFCPHRKPLCYYAVDIFAVGVLAALRLFGFMRNENLALRIERNILGLTVPLRR